MCGVLRDYRGLAETNASVGSGQSAQCKRRWSALGHFRFFREAVSDASSSAAPGFVHGLVIAAVLLIAHGGALAIAQTENAPEVTTVSDVVHLSITLALSALVAAGLALIRPSADTSELKFQAIWLTLTPFAVFVFLVLGVLGG